MLKKILIAFVIVVAAFLVVVAMQPSTFRVERSATIAASPEAVFARVNDLHQWEAWSPWAKIDPSAKNGYEGPASGVGAAFTWSGNSDVGEGRLTITESRPHEFIRLRLDFVKPFKDTSTTEFSFKPEGNQTKVTWAMFGENNFLSKAMCLFISMDKMVGGKFEEGLASMKSVTEAATKK